MLDENIRWKSGQLQQFWKYVCCSILNRLLYVNALRLL